MTKLQWMLIVMVVGTLILAACGGPAPAAPSGGGAPAPSGAKATEAPQVPQSKQPAATPASNPPVDTGSNKTGNVLDKVEVSDVTEGLASLNSYTSTFTMSFDGKESGQPKQWTWTIEEEYSKNPPAKHSIMKGTGTSSQDTTFESIEVDGKSYSIMGNICASADSKEAPSSTIGFTPSSVIGDITTAQLLGTETINGVPTQHFQSDLSRFATLGQYSNAKSEVWIAQPGNYVMKYIFEATGKDAFFGSGNAEGTLHWVYELGNVNQPLNITAPENCGGAPQDIPVMADAKDQSSIGNMSTYTTPSAFDDVVAFYKKEMTTNGWQEKEGGMSSDSFTMLSYAKDKRTAQVTITADKDNNVTSVMITVTEPK
jgi:hypothetical protein